MKIELTDSDETELLGAALSKVLPPKCLVFLCGDLGAGKTTLMRGLLCAMGHNGAVKSPTYSLVEEYRFADRSVFHFDLYRLKDPEELEWLGFNDYLQQRALVCVEWPQMGAGYLPAADLEIKLDYQNSGRSIEINILEESLKNTLIIHWKNNDMLL
ncbi:MAG: tRNA (adenosine(37)-N6)-threonylcarbamoyltransferase complex ATPase subunit type 1 TsaE [Methylomonas sp.]|jgi:tRNA threonylcarbamoyladenosine biosynthesis protein TsaE|uniref:tRNA (adenosine(37)-N6)-threonylcarbamoyltransferase complex ATPase subunit type 1 TsaE n=1 Tax=Methylomonas sp. TaxID=418 RepID=UPI0025CF2E60|nr:tRNA (adenosine(37)-N6)-threonylcarbamoyltransferase complex ATPase subunit type 1 TsaE [Methylomonas sp.]MCK9606820.1 tRNA (adenosine(37)-N6)-threonylcarbamoyltransferase complex ATPase subunit type 1 TsaE [Methylomonas sp.]